jgi:hypothetical protein
MADKITDGELQSICNNFLRTSMGSPESEVGVVRDRNIRAYNAQPVMEFAPPEIEDRSQYVSQDVAEVVDGMLPQLLDVFVSDESALTCTPTKPDEPPSPQHPQGVSYKAQAKAATAYLNHIFYTRNDGLNVLYDWIHDALLQKVGFVKVWVDEDPEDSRASYTGLIPDQVAALKGDGYEIENEEPQPDGTANVVAVKHGTRRVLKTAVVPPHQMRIDANARWGAEPNAIGSVQALPRFELEEMGYDVMSLAGIGSSVDDVEFYNTEATDMLGEVQPGVTAAAVHESYMLYTYAELYLKLDVDGDGTAEWRQCCLVNGILVHNEKTDGHPFAEMCLMPRPHAYFGDCPADRSYDVQKEHTNLARALFDNTYLSVNGRTYVNMDAEVNLDDLLDNRPAGLVRGRGAANLALAPVATPNLSSPAFQLGEWLQSQLENRTGFTRYSQGLDSDSLNKTATGVSIITQKADMRLRLMSRFAAGAIRTMFRKLLKMAIQHQLPQEWMRINGEFVAINPSEWADQFDLAINVGLGHGTKQQQAQRVMAMLPLQMQGMGMGIVGPQQIANTIRLFATLNEFKNPDDFVMPENAQPGQPPMPMQAMSQHLQQLQQQVQQLSQQNQMLHVQNANKQGELAVKMRELDMKARELDMKAQESGINSVAKLHKASLNDAESQHAQAKANLDNAAAAHTLGLNMGLAEAEKDWQKLTLAGQVAAQVDGAVPQGHL